MSYFATNLKYLRERKGISKQALADKIGVNASTISRWESDDMGVTVDNAYDVANFFDVSIADLTGKDLLKNTNNEKDQNIKLLYDKVRDLPEDKQQMILNITKEIMRDIDKEIDGK